MEDRARYGRGVLVNQDTDIGGTMGSSFLIGCLCSIRALLVVGLIVGAVLLSNFVGVHIHLLWGVLVFVALVSIAGGVLGVIIGVSRLG